MDQHRQDHPVKLIAEATDTNGRKFTFQYGTVKPLRASVCRSSSVHVGSSFNVSLPPPPTGGQKPHMELTQNGSVRIYRNLSNNGGSIAINATGSYVLTASTTDSAGRTFSYSQNVTVTNNAPNKPTGSASVTRTAKDVRLLVNISANATDPDGDAVNLEYSGNTADSCYAVGTHTVRVRAKDAWGLCSDWTDITFTVANPRHNAGDHPNPGRQLRSARHGDHHHRLQHRSGRRRHLYVWEGRPAQTSTAYPLGKNVVRVKAVDSTGGIALGGHRVFVADPNKGGGMT